MHVGKRARLPPREDMTSELLLPVRGLAGVKSVKQIANALDMMGCHLHVNTRCLYAGMAHQGLDCPKVSPVFQLMGGKTVSQRMGIDMKIKPRILGNANQHSPY